MFDFSFGELAVIGAVALVVLGPERLPKVARTVGEWAGKAQRYVSQVKARHQSRDGGVRAEEAAGAGAWHRPHEFETAVHERGQGNRVRASDLLRLNGDRRTRRDWARTAIRYSWERARTAGHRRASRGATSPAPASTNSPTKSPSSSASSRCPRRWGTPPQVRAARPSEPAAYPSLRARNPARASMTTDTTNPTNPRQEQSFLSHLVELRQRLVRAAVAV